MTIAGISAVVLIVLDYYEAGPTAFYFAGIIQALVAMSILLDR